VGVGPDLGRIETGKSFFELGAAMWNHLPRMGARMREARVERPTLTPRELSDLIAFLFTAQYYDEQGDAAAGQEVFRAKGCIRCHVVGGTGVGITLDTMKSANSPVLVAAAMWNHGPEMAETMKDKGIPRPKFEGREMVDLIAYVTILFSFIAITAHHMMMLIEYHLAVMLASVLVPWGIWRMSSGIAEFGLGWLTGSLIRALVSSALIGIATPTFELLHRPIPGTGYYTLSQTFILMGGAFVYLVLAWVIPANAARMAGQASLGLTGATFTAAASSMARFGMMAMGLNSAISRVISPMLRRT